MRKAFPQVVSMVLALMLCFCSAFVVPAQASISITGGSGGITIKPGAAPDMTDVGDAFDTASDKLISKGQQTAKTITAVCSIICFVVFFISVAKLATSGGHPMQRRAAIIGILWSGVAIALFGGSWIVVSFFWNFLT